MIPKQHGKMLVMLVVVLTEQPALYYLTFQARTLLTTLTETLDSLGRQLLTFASDSDDNSILVNAEGIGKE